MNKFSLLLAGTLVVTISSCGARDESQPLFGSPAAPVQAESSSGGTVSETNNTSNSVSETTQDSGVNSSVPLGVNLGDVPSTIIAEITTLNAADGFAMRGHKVFAGAPLSFGGTNYEYFNLDFPCEGDGLFEAYPSDLLENAPQESFGNFYWSDLDTIEPNVFWGLRVTDILTGDLQGVQFPNFLAVDPVVNGDIIVNTTFIEGQPVSRIVQYQQCS